MTIPAKNYTLGRTRSPNGDIRPGLWLVNVRIPDPAGPISLTKCHDLAGVRIMVAILREGGFKRLIPGRIGGGS